MTVRSSSPIWVGRNVDTGKAVDLSRHWFETHMHIIGPPGSGKSRFLLWIFEHLARDPEATVIMLNPKGDILHMAHDLAVARGLTKRLVAFDPGDPEYVLGYNPLRPNGLQAVAHASAVREGLLAAWGQVTFDQTPQLARFLLLALAAARAAELTLVEAMTLLRSGRNTVRAAVIRMVSDPWIRDALVYFDELADRRQDELAASTLARLEAFVANPQIRTILTQQDHSLDLRQVIDERKLLLINLEQKRPLQPDDVRLLGRLIVNDIVAHVFSRDRSERSPVYLLIDEAQMFITRDLCSILDQGREIGLHCVLGHQHLGQLREEEASGYLYESVLNCARTKVVFGGIAVAHLKQITPEILLDQYDPWAVKDEITSLELDPVEETRQVESFAVNEGVMSSRSESEAYTYSVGVNAGRSVHQSSGGSRGTARSIGSSSTSTLIQSDGHVLLPTGEMVISDGDAYGASDGVLESTVNSATEAWQSGQSRSRAIAKSRSKGRQAGTAIGRSRGVTRTVAEVPFYRYRKRRVVSSRTFLTEAEFLTLGLQRIQAQPRGHCVLKVPTSKAVFLKLPFVKTPWISQRVRDSARERIFAQPFYRQRVEVEAEEKALVRLPVADTLKSIRHDDEAPITHGRRRSATRQR